jgi:hypothetical protein
MMCKVVQRGGVYTGLSKGARGILFPDNGDQRLPVEDGKDAEGDDAALSQKRSKPRFIECLQDAVMDRFP